MSSKRSIPESWISSTIGEHTQFEGGTQPPRSTFIHEEKQGYIRLVQTRDFKTDKYRTYIPKTANHKTFSEDNIMIGRYGPPVFQIYRGLSGAYNVALIKATPKGDSVTNDYLYYTLRQERLFRLIDSLSRRSSGQSGVDMDALKNFSLPLPPIDEQKAICQTIHTWDCAVETLDRLIDTRQQQHKALAHQLVFGQLRSKSFGTTKKKTKHRWFTLPSDWDVKSIGDVAEEISERNGEATDREVLSCSKHEGFVRSLEYFKKKVYSGDLSSYKNIRRGEFGFPSNHIEEGSIGLQDIADIGVVSPIYTVFRFDPERIHNSFAFSVLKTSVYRHIFEVSTSASVDRRGSLRWGEFSKIPFPLPPLDEQRSISAILARNGALIDGLRAERDVLVRQRGGLMQKLLTGELRVSATSARDDDVKASHG